MKRRGLHRVTIRKQLAGLALVVAVPLLCAIAYTTYSARENAGEAAEHTSSQLAAVTASSVQEFFDDTRADLAVVAARPLVRRMDPARCDPFLLEAHLLNRYSAGLVTVSLEGKVVCSALPAPPEGLPSVAESEWFQELRRSGRLTVSQPFLGRISHKRIALLALPIVDRGRRLGYVALPIDLVHFQELFARLAEHSDALVSVVTKSGLIVARSHDAKRFVGTRLRPDIVVQLIGPPNVAVGIDGVERIFARAPVAETSWVVVAGVPTEMAYGASNRLLTIVLILSAALLVLAFLAAIVTGRWIAGPVQALAQRASDIAAGGRHAGPLRGSHEVSVAAKQLDEMVAALWESEHQLTQVLDAAGMGAWALDLDSGLTWRSHQHDRIFGYATPLAHWSLDAALAHVVPDDRALVKQAFAEMLETDHLVFESRVVWPDASEHWIRAEGRVERGEDAKPLRVVGTVADVTERVRNDDQRKLLEEELRQSQKMEAVGQLAGGIAHDFNNLLTAISGYSELALVRLGSSDPELRGDIEQIARAGERAAQLTRQLLAYSRRQTLQTSVFDLNEAVSDSETLLRRLLGEHIEILTSQTPYQCPVDADRGQIEQILINLAVNARDAMPDGGTLTIETETIADEDTLSRQFDTPDKACALLRVSDTGSGMDTQTRERAFEPFFTTKPPGEGTGLGLATVFGSVRQNGGSITLTSEQGVGTTFEVLLPLVPPVSAPTASPIAPARILGTERILLVEDEEMVRTLVRTILVGKGYDVLVASDGEQALSLSQDEPFDLLLTDMVMPKMSGKELADNLRGTRPDLPVIYMSGYAHDVTGNDGLNSADAFIQKPFPPHDLGATIRALLDSQRAADDTPTATLTLA